PPAPALGPVRRGRQPPGARRARCPPARGGGAPAGRPRGHERRARRDRARAAGPPPAGDRIAVEDPCACPIATLLPREAERLAAALARSLGPEARRASAWAPPAGSARVRPARAAGPAPGAAGRPPPRAPSALGAPGPRRRPRRRR